MNYYPAGPAVAPSLFSLPEHEGYEELERALAGFERAGIDPSAVDVAVESQ